MIDEADLYAVLVSLTFAGALAMLWPLWHRWNHDDEEDDL